MTDAEIKEWRVAIAKRNPRDAPPPDQRAEFRQECADEALLVARPEDDRDG